METVFRVAQFPHHDGQIAQFFPECPHSAQELLRVGFQLLRGKTVALALMPQDRGQRGGAHSQLCLKDCMVKQHLARLPLADAGTAVCAGNQADFSPGFFLQLRGKACGKVCAAARNCPLCHRPVHIDGLTHGLPAPHAQHEAIRGGDGVLRGQIAPSCHVRLSHQ